MQKKTEALPVLKLDRDEDIHVMPMDDWFNHLPSINCVCRPFPDTANEVEVRAGLAVKEVYVHRRIKEDREGCH